MPKSWILSLLLLCHSLPNCFAAEGPLLNITVVADQTKANGEPWDGLPGVGGGRGSLMIPLPNSNAPPDLAICIIRLGGASDCIIRHEGGKEYSFCQNAHDCTFRRIAIPDAPFGMIILDLDLQRHDLVDFLILKPESGASAAELGQLEELVRSNVEKLAPPFTEGERQRRKREILALSLERCTGTGKACKLVQSELRMNWAD